MEGVEEAVELGTLAGVATDVFGVDTLAAGVLQCVDLQLRILIDGGDSGITNFHSSVTLQPFSTTIVSPECYLKRKKDVQSVKIGERVRCSGKDRFRYNSEKGVFPYGLDRPACE